MLGKILHWVQHFAACVNGFCFAVYVSMTVYVAWFDFSIFDCMHNLKQTYDYVLKSGAARGEGDISAPRRSILRS